MSEVHRILTLLKNKSLDEEEGGGGEDGGGGEGRSACCVRLPMDEGHPLSYSTCMADRRPRVARTFVEHATLYECGLI